MYYDVRSKKRQLTIDEELDDLRKKQLIQSHYAEIESHKALEEFYKKINNLPVDNKDEFEKQLQEITNKTNKDHNDYVKFINNGAKNNKIN